MIYLSTCLRKNYGILIIAYVILNCGTFLLEDLLEDIKKSDKFATLLLLNRVS